MYAPQVKESHLFNKQPNFFAASDTKKYRKFKRIPREINLSGLGANGLGGQVFGDETPHLDQKKSQERTYGGMYFAPLDSHVSPAGYRGVYHHPFGAHFNQSAIHSDASGHAPGPYTSSWVLKN